MEVYDLSEENELDTYISREVPVPEGDEAQNLTQEEIGELGLLVPGVPPLFSEKEYIGQLHLKRSICLSN